jgi:hypothetical protein
MKLWCFLCVAAIHAQEKPLPMRFANLASCPAPGQAADVRLLRVEDSTGTAIEAWCTRQGPGFAYEFKLVSADGRSIRLEKCQLQDGVNAVGVDHLGTVAESPAATGTPVVKVSGRIARFFHHNWDTQMGHHAIYDFRRKQMTYYGTEAYRDEMGRWIRLLTGAAASEAIPQAAPASAMGKLNGEREFDPKRVACVTAKADDGMKIEEVEVDAYLEPGKLGKAVVAWPETTLIEGVEFNAQNRKLKLKFPPGTRKTMISVAFPRRLIGFGKEITKVNLDGRFVATEEYLTATHRAVRFRIDEPAKEATLTESGGFPFFLVSSVAIGGGLVIGTVVAFLWRKKLPPVEDESAQSQD